MPTTLAATFKVVRVRDLPTVTEIVTVSVRCRSRDHVRRSTNPVPDHGLPRHRTAAQARRLRAPACTVTLL